MYIYIYLFIVVFVLYLLTKYVDKDAKGVPFAGKKIDALNFALYKKLHSGKIIIFRAYTSEQVYMIPEPKNKYLWKFRWVEVNSFIKTTRKELLLNILNSVSKAKLICVVFLSFLTTILAVSLAVSSLPVIRWMLVLGMVTFLFIYNKLDRNEK